MGSRRASALFLVLIPVALAAACGGSRVAIGENDQRLQKNPDGSATGNGQTCTYGGVTVGVGQAFKSPDGCNDCKCAADGAYCTERGCLGDAGGQCKGSDGQIHNEGETYPSADGCNTCSCNANGEACTKRACANDCSAKGACGPAPGMPNWQCADGSVGGPVCEPTSNGTCGWNIRQCVCKDASGTVHKAGESWNDGCNSCSCDQQGRAACTAMACVQCGTVTCKAGEICCQGNPFPNPTCVSGPSCPVSRREYKKDISYLSEQDRSELREDLLRTKLATYRYKGEDGQDQKHLGFMINDMGDRSPAVENDAQHVDLYGYTSMAVATVQLQQEQIVALQKQIDELRRELAETKRSNQKR